MARYTVRAPDGNLITLEGPEGASDADVIAQAQRLTQEAMKPAAPVQPEQPATPSPSGVAAPSSGLLYGMKDPITAGAQMLEKALPESVVSKINEFNNWLAEKGLVSELPKGGLNQLVQEEEQAYQAARKARGEEGLDVDRIAGNVLSPANIAVGTRAAQGVKALGLGKTAQTVGTGVATGASGSALMPVYGPEANTTEDFWAKKAGQITEGTVVGGGLGIAGSLWSKYGTPVKEGAQELIDAGIKVSPGKAYGGVGGWFFRNLEEFKIPGLSENTAQVRQQYTRSIGNEVLGEIGESVPANIKDANSIYAFVKKTVSSAYDDVLGKIPPTSASSLIADAKEAAAIAAREIKGATNSSVQGRAFERKILNLFNAAKSGVDIDGKGLQGLKSYLNTEAKKLAGRTDPASVAKRTAYDELAKTVKAFSLQADQTGMLQNINNAYNKQMTLALATRRANRYAEGSGFGPADVLRSIERRKDAAGAQAIRGELPMYEQAKRAKDILGTLNDSQSNKILGILKTVSAATGFYMSPATGLALLTAAGIPYKSAELLLKKPELRSALTTAIERLGPAEAARISAQTQQQEQQQ